MIEANMKLRKIYLMSGILLTFICSIISSSVRAEDNAETPINISMSSNSPKYSKEFISHLVKCQKYKEESSFDFFGNVITPVVIVDGWKNGKCGYINYAKEIPESKTICNFTKAQLNEILAASKKNQNVQETYNDGVMTYKADPLSVLFTKYMNDGKTCVIPK